MAKKSQPSHGPEKVVTVNYTSNETEEPPSRPVIVKNLEEEPPSITATGRYRLFGNVPESSWKDWKWQFRNRIVSIDQLNQLVRLSVEEQAQIRMVTQRYPLSITPYYLSLINPDDPDDPIRKQAIPSILEITMSAMGLEDPLGGEGRLRCARPGAPLPGQGTDGAYRYLPHALPPLHAQEGMAARRLGAHRRRK